MKSKIKLFVLLSILLSGCSQEIIQTQGVIPNTIVEQNYTAYRVKTEEGNYWQLTLSNNVDPENLILLNATIFDEPILEYQLKGYTAMTKLLVVNFAESGIFKPIDFEFESAEIENIYFSGGLTLKIMNSVLNDLPQNNINIYLDKQQNEYSFIFQNLQNVTYYFGVIY